jgi:predicted RND superfamily exporter protein
MKTFAQCILKWRAVIIVLTLVITLVLGFGMTKLTINSDFTSYLKPGDPAIILFNRIGDEYGGNLIVMIAVQSDDMITYPSLSLIADLSNKYSEVEGVATVTSLVNIVDIRDAGYGLEVGKLIGENDIPKEKEELQKLREYILSNDTYRGKIISEDGTTTLIICKLYPEYNKIEVAKELLRITEASKGSYNVFYSGYPVQMIELDRYIANDIKTLIPIVFVIILLVLYFSFRTFRGVLCPLLIVVISTIWTMGLLGYTDTPLTVLSNVIPVILLALGTAYGIHFLSRYYEDITQETTKRKDIITTIRHIGVPILLTALTTIAGFLSFTGAYITAISEFGIFTAAGILFAMILSLTFLPAVLSYLKVKPIVLAKGEKEHILRRVMHRMSGVVFGNEKKIIIIGLIVAVIGLAIIPRIKPETAIINFFPKKSEIRKADSMIQETFGGSTTINIVLQGDIKAPHTLKSMLLLEKYLEHLPNVQNTQSLADLISRMNDVMNRRRTIPETREEVANLLFLLEGEEILEQMVAANYSEAIVQATFGSLDSKALNNTIREIEEYCADHINGSYAIVSTSPADMIHAALIDEWKYNYCSRAIYYDVISRDKDRATSQGAIMETVRNLYEKQNVLLGRSQRKELQENLTTFFTEESEVYVDSPSDIENTIEALIRYAEGQPADKSYIDMLLERIIPEKYYRDHPQSISNTGTFVYAKILNAQNESRISEIAAVLIQTLFTSSGSDPEFKKTIQDDLWVLTENSAIIPEHLLQNPGDSSSSMQMGAELTGMIRIVQRLNESLIKSQIQSIIIAIIVVFFMLSLQFRSIRMGAVVLSPIVLVILINFALMGYFGIPLDYATMLVGSIMIGVGIDYSIHFSSRFKLEYGSSGNEHKSLERTLKTTGIAIVSNALMVALGFFVLVGGKFIPVKREGWMIGVLMILSAFAALIFLPSLILRLKGWVKLNNNINKKPGGKHEKNNLRAHHTTSSSRCFKRTGS